MVHEVKTQNQGKYKIFHPLRKGKKKKKQRHDFADKGPYNQGYGLSSCHVQM